MKSKQQGSAGISFFGLLGIVFIALKLGGVINWNWWLVLLPLYGGVAAVLSFTVIATIFYMVYKLMGGK